MQHGLPPVLLRRPCISIPYKEKRSLNRILSRPGKALQECRVAPGLGMYKTGFWIFAMMLAGRVYFAPHEGAVHESAVREPTRRLSGHVRIVDGDTVKMHGVRLRLYGIDAPEKAQTCERGGQTWPCGREATRALGDVVGAGLIDCDELGIDRYNRPIVRCFAGGRDLNGWMVSQGWAVAYRRYSSAYVREENAARRRGRGIWAGTFVPPETYRHRK